MSMYNALFGVNPFAGVLVSMLELETEKYPTGRFRDIYLKKNGEEIRICLFTRNGGGNREDYQCVFDALKLHPNYLRDYDDDFDCTYATIEFSVPKGKIELCEHILEVLGSQKPPMERFQELIDKLKGGDNSDSDVQRAMDVGKKIFGEIKKKMDEPSSSYIVDI